MTSEPSSIRRGLLLVVSSPSGAGKTTLTRMLASRMAPSHKLEFSVSYTTRSPRLNERDGVDYSFVVDEQFSRMVEGGRFAEWAVVHGNKYGTCIDTVNRALEQGIDTLFDIDWQGGQQIRRQWPDDSVLVFILPPSMRELERRLRTRATDAKDVIDRRLATALRELEHFTEYDYLVVNEDVERAYDELRAIYLAARCTRTRLEARARALLEDARARETGRTGRVG